MFEIILVVVRWCRMFNEEGIIIENCRNENVDELVNDLFKQKQWNTEYIKYVAVFTFGTADAITKLEFEELKNTCVNKPFQPRESITGRKFGRFTCKSVKKVNEDNSGRYDSLSFG